MLANNIQDELRQKGFRITEVKAISNGIQTKLLEGACISVFPKKVLVQGKAVFDSPEQLQVRLEYVLPARSTVWKLS